jgi:FkbM family methyltransferase
MNSNFTKQVIKNGGSLHPIIIPADQTNGTGLMNPSIYNDNGKLIMNLRHVNYTLYHCEGEQLYINRWGPLAYLNPENDLHLRTTNYFCEVTDNLEIKSFTQIDTSKLDVPPIWQFVGLEDGRLVRWNDKLYICGVRRDTTSNGEGRMEMSELEVKDGKVREIKRSRIRHPYDQTSYCEKNWMVVTDMPNHMVKWTNPTEVVEANPNTLECFQRIVKPGTGQHQDMRGSSQIIPYKGKRICVIHEVDLFKNKLNQKDGKYTHRFVIWDMEWNIEHISEPFSFMNGEIEFCCGLTEYKDDLLITFGFQDNAAYILRMPQVFFDTYIEQEKSHKKFNWGEIADSPWFQETVTEEVFIQELYTEKFPVDKDDIVLDIGASAGPFTYSILHKEPKHVYCFEPKKTLFDTMTENIGHHSNVTLINKGITGVNGETEFKGLYFSDVKETWGRSATANSITFDTFLKEYNVEHIDFMKIDCEGGEYDIFIPERLSWIKQNVKKIVGEWHLSKPELKEKFRKFRDTYLKEFHTYEVYSMDGVDIKWDLWNDSFIDYYSEITLYIDNRKSEKKEHWRLTNLPTLEFTTSIPPKGCVIDCAFCPQRTLLNVYKADKTMTFENFKKVIDKLPKEVRVTFSGFTEPWLNKRCTDMLIYASQQGHPIAAFTTGVGMTVEDVERIKDIKFDKGENGGLCLHIPDQELIAKHPITPRLIEVFERFKELENHIEGFYVMCMGEVHESVKHLWSEVHVPTFWSRAGNLLGEAIIKPELEKYKDRFQHMDHGDKPMTCGCVEDLYHNVVLPNGDVSLCCMDYGLKHILGNIFEQDYEDVIPRPLQCFSLCQGCENAISPDKKK